jgi:hypothetical protein
MLCILLRDQILDRILMIQPCIAIIDISFLASDLCLQTATLSICIIWPSQSMEEKKIYKLNFFDV